MGCKRGGWVWHQAGFRFATGAYAGGSCGSGRSRSTAERPLRRRQASEQAARSSECPHARAGGLRRGSRDNARRPPSEPSHSVIPFPARSPSRSRSAAAPRKGAPPGAHGGDIARSPFTLSSSPPFQLVSALHWRPSTAAGGEPPAIATRPPAPAPAPAAAPAAAKYVCIVLNGGTVDCKAARRGGVVPQCK